ncbi:calcium uptake protein 3, mitochondrial [Eurytemora carolleeae]|uniref:calcium uptake protein 3, mitochondrial n=1 Tax=Eurytemora carolleeae TaxID=1294199 RepID=UPI000C763D8C|nr:calcium uptake protein 3, mitochondrial [Eurytemora carolleeae]|eukprot:XP_023325942.1 calcium uptake protein 3, mitochondrial-like [Eurytemora affinis]
MGSRGPISKLRLSTFLGRGGQQPSSLPPPVSRMEMLSSSSRGFMFALTGFLGGSGFIYYLINPERMKMRQLQTIGGEQEERKRILSPREKRFIKFSSVELNGQIFMTPQDFLDSVVESEPKPRIKRRKLTLDEVYRETHQTLQLKDDFQNIGSKGLISYSEYLFLLTILIKPTSGFRIAFSMLDHDGNEKIDKVITYRTRHTCFLERREVEGDSKEDDFLQKDIPVDTTILVHFFGKKGDRELRFEDFTLFMESLQTEVLHMEFGEFSKGAGSISELDFARILLRYTDYETILNRLYERLEEEKGISFEEFKDFCQFLNNLEDFQIAMRMYTLADKAITQEEFSRAVYICTGKQLSSHIVQTVFQIFDDDGDGLLSYQEFVAIMKDRIHRGLKSYAR